MQLCPTSCTFLHVTIIRDKGDYCLYVSECQKTQLHTTLSHNLCLNFKLSKITGLITREEQLVVPPKNAVYHNKLIFMPVQIKIVGLTDAINCCAIHLHKILFHTSHCLLHLVIKKIQIIKNGFE
jgi:hypothetical protein